MRAGASGSTAAAIASKPSGGDFFAEPKQRLPGEHAREAGRIDRVRESVDGHPAKKRAAPLRAGVLEGPVAKTGLDLEDRLEENRPDPRRSASHEGRGVRGAEGVLEVVGPEADIEGQHHRSDPERAEEGMQPGRAG